VSGAGLDDVVADSRVVVCCGSGGVGKTTTAAVIGIEAARRGRRVVVVTIDPARRLADALGLPDGLSGSAQRVPLDSITGEGELWAMMLDTPAMFERVVRANAVDDEQADRIVENRFYQNIAEALSGTQEYMASEALHELRGDERFDLVVVDTPPSRSALDFLEAPGVLARFLDHKAFKLMMVPTRTGFRMLSVATQPILRAIGRIVGSDVLTDAVAFFQAFSGMDVGFRERAEEVTALLHDDSTKFFLVSSPQRDTVIEAAWFADQIADAARERGDDDVAALWANLAELRTVADAERRELQPLADRVGSDAIVEVPLLPSDVHDVAALTHLGAHLFRASDQGA